MQDSTKIVLFKNKQVRKTLHNNEWWFAVNDIIEALTDSRDPAQYFKRIKERDEELSKLTDKGGYNLYHPLCWVLKLLEGYRKHIAGIRRAFSASSNPSSHRMPNPSK